MKLRLARLGALVLVCTAIPQAIAGNLAEDFVRALQHREFDHAAAMFVPDTPGDKANIAASLKRLDEKVGGLSSIRRAERLPNGKSVRVLVQARPKALESVPGFEEFIYVGTDREGQTVYYQVDLSKAGKAPQVLAFAVDFPDTDRP